MLKIVIPETELFNSETSEFYYIKEQTLLLEHSLLSVSKWESKWKKPFIDPYNEKTAKETLDYIRCMTITKGVDPLVYKHIPNYVIDQVNEYIKDSMTATTFNDRQNAVNREIITSEIIYYWMVALNVPFECQKWHLNKLLALLKVCGLKTNGSKKMSQREIMERNNALNEQRKRESNTKG